MRDQPSQNDANATAIVTDSKVTPNVTLSATTCDMSLSGERKDETAVPADVNHGAGPFPSETAMKAKDRSPPVVEFLHMNC
ncbi:MAG: hypothetical protein HQL41_18865 [Alphaproteobacteria bacterium]|nr:hypothetical protein [Alphaproteobacteria bacterium]